MTVSELARFLKEEVPRIKHQLHVEQYGGTKDLDDCLTALDCLVGLLREAADAALPFINLKDRGEYVLGVITQADIRRLEETLATLRLVVGEKE